MPKGLLHDGEKGNFTVEHPWCAAAHTPVICQVSGKRADGRDNVKAGTAHFASDMRVLSAIEYDRSAPQVPRQLVDAEPAAVVQAEAEGSARPAAVVQVDRSHFKIPEELVEHPGSKYQRA